MQCSPRQPRGAECQRRLPPTPRPEGGHRAVRGPQLRLQQAAPRPQSPVPSSAPAKRPALGGQQAARRAGDQGTVASCDTFSTGESQGST